MEVVGLINIGMTQEQLMDKVKPAPAEKYRLVLKGFMENPNANPSEDVHIFTTKAGGKMIKAIFTIVGSPDPAQNGKPIIYMATLGAFSLVNLAKVLPIIVGTDIDTESAVGMEIFADVEIRKYTNPETGETVEGNNIKKMYPAT